MYKIRKGINPKAKDYTKQIWEQSCKVQPGDLTEKHPNMKAAVTFYE